MSLIDIKIKSDAISVEPSNIELEQSILGNIIIAGSKSLEMVDRVADILSPNYFFDHKNRILFATIINLWNDQVEISSMSVQERLSKLAAGENAFSGLGLGLSPSDIAKEIDTVFINGLFGKIHLLSSIDDGAKIIREKYILRQILTVSRDMQSLAFENRDVGDILDMAQKKLFEIGDKTSGKDFYHIGQVVEEGFENMELLNQGSDKGGAVCGFIDLDKKLGGFQNSDLIILAARPSMGKTSLAMDFARNNCKQGKSVAFFSMEMSSLQLAQRLIASVSGISLGKIRGGHVGTGENSQAEFDKLGESIETISKYPLWIDDSGGLNLLQIKSKLRRLKARTNVDLVIIDYLQLMSANNNKNAGNRVQEVSEISRGLKILAKEIDVPIIALSQLSRGVESRDDKRPMLSDLRESGSIEQDADVVMFIYRDAVYNKQIKEERKNVAEILISKHRNGETGSIEVFWDARFTSFRNLEGSHNRRIEK